MAKNIVLCFDGTWNDPNDNTNVIKIFRSIVGEDRSPGRVGGAVSSTSNTIKWYDEGVGTKRWNRLRGGLTGRGLARNILQGYRFLVENYQSGEEGADPDQIYLFGFSRGAYTARSLAGLIRKIGILRKANVPEAEIEDNPVLMNGFEIYRRRDASADTDEADFFRTQYSFANVEIKFLGVWDTVGAMGIPSNELDRVDQRYEFHDTRLSSRVRNAYHALAIDETRPEFTPTLWTSTPAAGQTVEQAWFAGVHSEVGGGEKEALTNIPLRWMQEKARENGLEIDPDRVARVQKEQYLDAPVADHFKLSWGNYYPLWAWVRGSRPHVRPIGGTPVECVHRLVHEKIDAHNGYAPGNHGLAGSAECVPDSSDTWESPS